ncbi:MAG: geranylgeranylglycerol-phosphate geranylgeranyltransferase [Chitinophagaceae bacterium]|nr:geranylgeranylglycerol-phosphate geranylgeranyltransferase [Chitinophagaceae bacterium]
MKLAGSFLRLVRWPNLLFIALTQLLFYSCIIMPSLPLAYGQLTQKLTPTVFAMLVLASVFIAAAGYIINDYFDINIDRVNKPGKMVVEKVIKRRWAIILHFLITIAGIIISFYVSYKTSRVILLANIGCAVLLWFYSTSFKKKLLSGNIIISLLTAWVIIVLYLAVNTVYLNTLSQPAVIIAAMKRIFKFAVLYAGFAFIISLIREVVKDIEDMEGDEKYNCKTMPIVWGVPAAKVFVGVWTVVLVGAIAVVIVYMLLSGWWLSALYCLILLVIPLLVILKQFYKAKDTEQYHAVSSKIKWVMFAGILSMLLLRFYL